MLLCRKPVCRMRVHGEERQREVLQGPSPAPRHLLRPEKQPQMSEERVTVEKSWLGVGFFFFVPALSPSPPHQVPFLPQETTSIGCQCQARKWGPLSSRRSWGEPRVSLRARPVPAALGARGEQQMALEHQRSIAPPAAHQPASIIFA